MPDTPGTPVEPLAGREAAGVVAVLRSRILSGQVTPGEFLPTVRAVSEEHEVSCGTAWRALKALESEGLVAARPRHGFLVLSRAWSPEKGCPVAYVLSAQSSTGRWEGLNQALLTGLQEAAARRGSSLLGIGQKGASPAKVLEQLKAARAWGVIVDVHSPGVVHLAKQSGLSVVMVDAWHEDAEVDAVIQDGFRGGLLAAKHLAGRGHRRIGWLGPVSESIHSMTRFGGATSGLRRSGLELPPELQADTAGGPGFEAARALLSRPDRPTGLLALWRDMALDAAKAARELGLALGKDLELVGWCPEELYDQDFAERFRDQPVPAAVVWSIATLAETAVTRLTERRANPQLPPIGITVQTRLRLAE